MDNKMEIMSIIEEIGFLTGSRVFDCANDDSDWDYVVLFEDFQKELYKKRIGFRFNDPEQELNIPEYLITDKEGYKKDKHFRSYRISDDSYTFNILMVWDVIELEVWKKATKIIQLLPLEMLKDKDNRILLFDSIKTVQRNLLNVRGVRVE